MRSARPFWHSPWVGRPGGKQPAYRSEWVRMKSTRRERNLIEQKVVDISDADAAVCWGPGLGWGIMAPNLLFHSAGGQGGIQYFIEHLAPPIAEVWRDLGVPELTAVFQKPIIDGVRKEVGSGSLEQIARERDEMLLGLLRWRSKLPSVHRPRRK